MINHYSREPSCLQLFIKIAILYPLFQVCSYSFCPFSYHPVHNPSLLLLVNCSKPKTVLICGDHVCINKAEAEQFFEENLTIEVKILDKKMKKNLDLVELNLRDNPKGPKSISITSKADNNKFVF